MTRIFINFIAEQATGLALRKIRLGYLCLAQG